MRYRVFLTLTLLVLLAVACQPSPAPTQAPAPKPAAAPTQAPAKPAAAPTQAPAKPAAAAPTAAAGAATRGGTLVVALSGDPNTINPTIDVGTTAVPGCKILEGLVSVSPDQGEIRPELATSWQISPDGRTYTFRLRQGVLWHDGKPFTSEDVKWTLQNVTKINTLTTAWLPNVQAIETPDPLTLVLKLKEPFAPLLGSLACNSGGAIAPKDSVPAGVDVRRHQPFTRSPVGTGPFVFKEWVPADRIVLVRNDKYWKKDLPYLDQIVAKIIPDPAAMVLALRAGQINYIDSLLSSVEDAAQLRNDPKIAIFTGTQAPTFHHIQLNHRRPPLEKPDVRKALFMAIDRNLLLNNVYRGFGKLLENMVDERIAVAAAPAVNIQTMYPYDVARANKLLDDAGLTRKADGSRFQLRLVYELGRGEWKEVAEVIRANWDRIGVKLVAEPAERVVMLDKVFKKRDFDTTFQSYATRGDPALGAARAFICEDDKNPPNFGNPTGYCRKDVDELFAEAARTVDFEKRREVYRRVQKILAEDLSIINFMGIERVALADKQFDFSGPRKSDGGFTGWEHVYRVR